MMNIQNVTCNSHNNRPIWKILLFAVVIVYCTHLYLSHLDYAHATHPASILPTATNEAILVNPQNLPSQGKIHSPIRKVVMDFIDANGHSTAKQQVDKNKQDQVGNNLYGEVDGRAYKIFNRTILEAERKDMLRRLQNFKLSAQSVPVNTVKDYGNKTLSTLRVLHIPRTGTYTLVTTAVHYCCQHLQDVEVDPFAKHFHSLRSHTQLWNVDPTCRTCLLQPVTINGDMWAHYPYIADLDQGHAIAILRSPRERLASQLNHMRSLEGLMTSFGISNIDAAKISMIFKHRFIGKKEDFLAMLTSADPHHYAPITLNSMTKNIQEASQIKATLSVSNNNSPGTASKTVSSLAEFSNEFLQKVDECYSKIQSLSKPTRDDLEPCRWQLVALFPGILSCQTKMLLGKSCANSGVKLTDEDLALAKQRIDRDFAFVGIFEKWEESIKAFHQRYGGILFEEEFRRSNEGKHRSDRRRAIDALNALNLVDPFDEAIYQYAVDKMSASIRSLHL